MKIIKLFFYTCVLALSGLSSFGQCTPDSLFTKPGIFPDTLINLDTAFPGMYYQMTMTAIVPKDTLVFGNRIPIDSIGISKFEGLPAGFTVAANTASSYWHGGKSGCVLISGTASEADAGVYPLQIQVIAVVGGIPAPYAVPGYKLIVDGNSGIQNDIRSNRPVVHYPNPFNNQSIFQFSSVSKETVVFNVYSADGRLQKSELISANPGSNNIVFSRANLQEGVYLYRFIFTHTVCSGTFVIKN